MQFTKLKIEQIKNILVKELPNYSSDSIDKIVISLNTLYYPLERYIYSVK